MHPYLILLAFNQAGLEIRSADLGLRAQRLSEVLLNSHGEACDAQALLEWRTRVWDGEALHLRATVAEALSRYVGYEDYPAFVREFDPDLARTPGLFRR